MYINRFLSAVSTSCPFSSNASSHAVVRQLTFRHLLLYYTNYSPRQEEGKEGKNQIHTHASSRILVGYRWIACDILSQLNHVCTANTHLAVKIRAAIVVVSKTELYCVIASKRGTIMFYAISAARPVFNVYYK